MIVLKFRIKGKVKLELNNKHCELSKPNCFLDLALHLEEFRERVRAHTHNIYAFENKK